MDEIQLITVASAAKQLEMSVQTVRMWAWCGRLPCVRLGRAVRFDKAIINRIAKEGLPLKK